MASLRVQIHGLSRDPYTHGAGSIQPFCPHFSNPRPGPVDFCTLFYNADAVYSTTVRLEFADMHLQLVLRGRILVDPFEDTTLWKTIKRH